MDIAICDKYLSSHFWIHSSSSWVVTMIFAGRGIGLMPSHTVPMRVVSTFDNNNIRHIKFTQNSLYIFKNNRLKGSMSHMTNTERLPR